MSPGLMIAMVLMVKALLLRLELCVFSYLVEPNCLIAGPLGRMFRQFFGELNQHIVFAANHARPRA